MTTHFTAIYEHGFLKPTVPIALEEGSQVELSIISQADTQNRPAPNQRTSAEILAEIAAMPMEPGGQEFAGRDHDKILYGERGAR